MCISGNRDDNTTKQLLSKQHSEANIKNPFGPDKEVTKYFKNKSKYIAALVVVQRVREKVFFEIMVKLLNI